MDCRTHLRLAGQLPPIGRTLRSFADGLSWLFSYRLLHDRLTEGFEIASNNQSMNSGPAWVIYLNSQAMVAKLPQVAYPYDIYECELHFKNQLLANQLLSSYGQTDSPATVVIDDLSEYFAGGAIPPTFSAKLVRVMR